jgi:hypothetical protein
MTSVKKPCINSSKHYYTGTELSPLHFGLSAEGYEINSVMEGYDKELWVVDIKNNKKVWVKNDTIIRITREDPVINNIEPKLNENNNNGPAHFPLSEDARAARETDELCQAQHADYAKDGEAVRVLAPQDVEEAREDREEVDVEP